ncbi:MAG: sigma 54-interacting transcriptional regulator [Deltaproteobacteria bacterium]|nr:sigma 54-interacting transcriptional regulator [Deltaproteobacteria bacterium]
MNRVLKEKKSSVLILKEQDSLPFLMALFDGSFSIDWIQELTQLKTSQLLNVIESNIREEWLVRESPGLYRLTDAKKQQLAQDRFSPAEKTLIHRKIADILIRDLPDDDDKAIHLAPHLLCILNDEPGCTWLARAGDLYEAARVSEKALHCYIKCLEDLNGINTEPADQLFIEIAVKYSRLSPARHDTIKALSLLENAMERAERRNNLSSEVLLSMHLAKNEWLRSRYTHAARYFESGWSKVGTIGDPKLLRSVTIYKIFYYYWCGRFREAIQFYESSMAKSGEPDTTKLPLLAEGMVAHCYAQIGQITRGMSMLDAIRKNSLETKECYGEIEAGVVMGLVMLDIRAPDEAINYLEHIIKEMRHNQNKVAWITAELGLAFAYYLKGDSRRSIVCLRALIREYKEIHINVRPFPYLIELCFAMEEGNLPCIDEVSLEKEIHRAIRLDNIFMKGVAYRFQALMFRRKSHPREKIVHSLNLSIKWLEESGHQAELARSHIELAREYLLAADRDKAVVSAQRAYELLSPINRELFPDDIRPLINELSLHGNTLQEILEFSHHMAHVRDSKEIIQQILLTINRIKGSERGALFLLDDPSSAQEPRLSVSRNLTSAEITHPGFDSSRTMIREVARTGQGLVMDAPLKKPGNNVTEDKIRSRICVPVILRGNVIGLLYLDNRFHSQIFREKDIEFVGHFAAMAALALDNSMAYEEIQKLNKKLREEKQTYKPQHLENLHFEGIVGESPPIKHVMSQVAQVANADTTVLILGETGVGKELVSRAIHRYSLRWNKPFVRVHCSTLPTTLIPSELFGHEKGAFTGAVNRRIGKFELADQGTIFLDEVGDIPLETQVRLLQVLQSKEFERIGGNKTIRSDFRLIAATNRNLEQEVVSHCFREDLYYRLNVFPIRVPPLRERKEDIPPLVHYFLKKYALEMGGSFNTIEDGDMEQLIQYDWPGNVRELENIIERGAILSHGSRFILPDLGIGHLGRVSAKVATTLKENERTHILWALQKTNWKLRGPNGAAELLDIHPSTLEFRMKKLGILRPQRPHREH